MNRSQALRAAVVAALLVPALSGCFNGPQATTYVQATMNSGNGTQAAAGAVKIDNATLVLGPEGSASATVLTRVTNTGPAPDQLIYASVNGVPAQITGDVIDLAPGQSVSFGYESDTWINAYDFQGAVSTYVPVELAFRDAGLVRMSILTVPPAGYYAGIAPNPPTAP